MVKKWVCPNNCGMKFESERSNPECPKCTAKNRNEGKNERVFMVEER